MIKQERSQFSKELFDIRGNIKADIDEAEGEAKVDVEEDSKITPLGQKKLQG